MSTLIDLQDSVIESHWNNIDGHVSEILDNMEQRETWVLDRENSIRDRLLEWSSSLDESSLEYFMENNPREFTFILSFIKSKRSLYFLNAIEKVLPGITSDLLLDALEDIESEIGDTRAQRILRDRLVALFRVDLLERIFSDERSEKIKQAIQYTSENSGGIYG